MTKSFLDCPTVSGAQFDMASSKRKSPRSAPAAADEATSRELLPLGRLTFEEFQSFCLAVVESEDGVGRCVEFGVSGDKQFGVDLVATMKDGTTWAIQCKRREQFSAGDAAKAVKDATFKADRYSLFLSRIATARVVTWGIEADNWDVWDARDISSAVRKMDPDKSSRLLRQYFEGEVARSFDGLRGPTPFTRAKDYFDELQRSQASLDYSTTLIGREAALASLVAWSTESSPRVAILAGRGGVGKTRLLIEFERQAAKAGVLIWSMDPAAADVDEIHNLPHRDCVVIVDDAQRADDIVKAVIALRRHRKHAIRPLLVCRPDGTPRLRSLLGHQHVEGHGVHEIEHLEDLSKHDCERLALSVLGGSMKRAAEAIADLAAGSPLVTVLAANIVKAEGEPAILRSANFRSTVLGRFYGTKLFSAPDVDPVLAPRLIAFIAALRAAGRERAFAES